MTGKEIVKVCVLAAAAISVLVLAPGAGLCKEPYKIGGIFSVTGASSFLGDPEKKSLEMAVDEINAKGGIDGRKLEVVIYDDEGDPGKAALAANKLIGSDNVVAIIGPSLTPTTLAIKPVAEKAQIPLVSCAAGIEITEPVTPYTFKTAQSDVLAVNAIFEHMKSKNIKKLGILTVDNAFGEGGKKQLTAQAPKFGYQIVQAETFGGKDTDMTAQLTKIRSAQPDAIVCWGTNPGPAVIAKNIVQMNIKTPFYQSHGVASPKFIELAEDAANGIVLPAGKILVVEQLPASDPQKAVLQNYSAEFQKRFSMPVSPFGGYAYDSMYILSKALAGTEGDKAKIRDNLEKLKGYPGVTGTFNFTPQDHNGLGADAFVMVEIRDKAFKLMK
jgi:branched-chain amino acid transport system substrate-binding protein